MNYHDYDHTQQRYSFNRTTIPRRPWSPDGYDVHEHGSDGGAIARYLELQERGQNRTSTEGRRGDVEHPTPYWERGNVAYDMQPNSSSRSIEQHADHHEQQRRRRERSDISVEALDLADYAQTLRRNDVSAAFAVRQHGEPAIMSPRSHHPVLNDVFPPISESYSRYPGTPTRSSHRSTINLDDPAPIDRPFSVSSKQSRVSTAGGSGRVPSLYLSAKASNSSHNTRDSQSSSRKRPQSRGITLHQNRRLSLPPVLPGALVIGPNPGEPAIFSASPSITTHSHPSLPHQHELGFHRNEQFVTPAAPAQPDVSRFPKWSRAWYDPKYTSRDSGRKRRQNDNTPFANTPTFPGGRDSAVQETDLGVWPPQAAPHDGITSVGYSSLPTYPGSRSPLSGEPTLPWGNLGHGRHLSDPPQYVPESVREERMRMLEREFGSKKGKERADEERVVGSVDSQGMLITDGPKRRLTARWLQTLLACLAAGAGLYGAMAIRPNPPAPPAGKPPAYILYGLSVLTFFFTLWFFHIHPCVRRRRKRKDEKYTEKGNPAGMMVLPVVQGLGLGAKGKKKAQGVGSGKKAKGPMGDGVQVNLIVDPMMLGGGRGRRESHSSDSDSDGSVEDDSYRPRKRRDDARPPKRRGVFQGMAMENDWREARKMLKWQLFCDMLLTLLWGAEFFYILWGNRCPPGGFEGWCNAYNVATACACLMSIAFAVGIYHDIRDLSASKLSPRTRT